MRKASLTRTTKETDISLELNVDGTGQAKVSTGVGFADHMLTLLAFWSGMDLTLTCQGDLHVDAHHTLEDVGLCLGQALTDALGDKQGVARVGFARFPLDEALSEAVVDLSGRAYLVYEDAPLPALVAGEEKDVWREFFKSLAYKGQMNLHLRMLYGKNGHHLLESAFKALGQALRQATSIQRTGTPSTKGSLG
ncbi:imidazoleglycerol-phosphate dehydratase HisB [Fundidesulfovibrio butyratiphilus]